MGAGRAVVLAGRIGHPFATDRSVPKLLRLLGGVDAVHGFYYLLLWPVVHFAGTREFEPRLPSALAMAAAALGIAAIGRRLRSHRAPAALVLTSGRC